MTIRALGYVQFKTHQVFISQDDITANIHCFKASDDRCDMQVFTEQDQANEYILTPFPSIVYSLIIAGDDQEE